MTGKREVRSANREARSANHEVQSANVLLGHRIRPSVRLSSVFLGNRGNSERETWTYFQLGGMHGKIRFWSGEARGSW